LGRESDSRRSLHGDGISLRADTVRAGGADKAHAHGRFPSSVCWLEREHGYVVVYTIGEMATLFLVDSLYFITAYESIWKRSLDFVQ
jgi:hypothetical protein